MKRLLILLLPLLLLSLPSPARAEVTQRDWALQLIDSLGWSYGLPEKPTDADYARMLDGKRVYRVEAEDARQRGDRVAEMNFTTFGKFSGRGWINGTRLRSEAHLKFNLPHAGRYKLKARVRLPGHHLIFGKRNFRLSGKQNFTDVEIGYVELQAGPQEALLQLQPNGSLDYFELEADPVGVIAPQGGWAFDEELTAEVAVRTTIQALKLQHDLPPVAQVVRLEAENQQLPAGVRVSRDTIKGEVSGNRYVQVGPGAVRVIFHHINLDVGVADLVLRAAGPGSVKTGLAGYFARRQNFGHRFEARNLGTFFLPQGEMSIEVDLPAGSSLDSLELHPRRATAADLLSLVGLPESGKVTADELNNLSALIYRLKSMRRD